MTDVNTEKDRHTAKPSATPITAWQAPVGKSGTTGDSPIRPLTSKQSAWVQHLVENPKSNPTQAALATYGNGSRPISYGTASQIAHDNLSKPSILLELSKHSQTAELVVVEVMNTSNKFSKTGDKSGSAYASVALQAANSLLDRLHGRATQRTEQRSEVVTLNIDLSGA